MALGFIFATTLDRDSARLQGPSGERGGLVSTAALPQFHTAALFPYNEALPVERTEGTPEAATESLTRGETGATARDPSPAIPPLYELLDPPVTLSIVEAATARTAAYGGVLTEEEMVSVLREAGWEEWVIPQALAISFCESRWSPYASGDGGVSLGLFQIGVARPGWAGWFQYLGVDESLAFDALTNAQVARMIWERSGWSPWSCAR